MGLPRHPAGAAAAEPPKWRGETGRGSSMRWPSGEQGTEWRQIHLQILLCPGPTWPATAHHTFFKPSLGTRADEGATTIHHLPPLESKDIYTYTPPQRSGQLPKVSPGPGRHKRQSRESGHENWTHRTYDTDGSEDAGMTRAVGKHGVKSAEFTRNGEEQKSTTLRVQPSTDTFVQM